MDESNITIGSGVRTEPYAPYVELNIDLIQVSPDAARAIAFQILQAAERADMDALLVTWFRESRNLSEEEAVKAVRDFNAYKEIRDSPYGFFFNDADEDDGDMRRN
jgi:hypothetical protein